MTIWEAVNAMCPEHESITARRLAVLLDRPDTYTELIPEMRREVWATLTECEKGCEHR